MEYAITVVVVVVAAVIIVKHGLRRVTVYEFERGLKYTRGRFQAIMPPGQYWYWPWFSAIRKADVRPRFVPIAGQEVLSSDGVTLKVSLAANLEVADPGPTAEGTLTQAGQSDNVSVKEATCRSSNCTSTFRKLPGVRLGPSQSLPAQASTFRLTTTASWSCTATSADVTAAESCSTWLRDPGRASRR